MKRLSVKIKHLSMKAKHLSVKMKITISVTLLVVLVSVAMCSFVIYFTNGISLRYLNLQLINAANAAEEFVHMDNGTIVINDEALEQITDVQIALCTLDGTRLNGSEYTFDLTQLPDNEMTLIRGRRNMRYAYKHPITVDEQPFYLYCRLPADPVESARAGVLRILLIIFPFAAIIVAVFSYFLTQHALRPLKQITQTAKSIVNGSDLKKRIGLNESNDEVSQVANTFDNMLVRIDRLFEGERRFISDASHELRTPISVIMAHSEYALSTECTIAEKDVALAGILVDTKHISSLIAQLLALSRIDSGGQPPVKERINLCVVTEGVVQELRYLAEQKNISISLESKNEIIINADQSMIMRMMINLLSNSIRYGHENGHVRIKLWEKDSHVLIRIEDDGIGISENDLPYIFNRFFQANSARGREGSSGLGLSIVQWIVLQHEGEISVTSELGHGTRFYITIKK